MYVKYKFKWFLYCCRLNFSTAFCSNAVSICKSVHLNKVTRIEAVIRYCIIHNGSIDKEIEDAVCNYNSVYLI